MTSQGHAYARFRRALERGMVTQAWAEAAELPHVALADALELTLLVAVREPQRYPRVLGRFIGRFCLEAPGVDAAEAAEVLRLLQGLAPGPAARAEDKAAELAALWQARGRDELAERLGRYPTLARAGARGGQAAVAVLDSCHD